MFSCVSINNIDYLYNKDISLFCVSVEDVQCLLWLSRLDLISSSLAHSTFPFEVAKPGGCSPFHLASSLLLSRQQITIWGFLECWHAPHPLADLRQKPCFDFPAYLVGRHRSLDRWTTHWIHTLMAKQNLVRIVKWGNWVFLSSLPFVSLISPFLFHSLWLSDLRNPTLLHPIHLTL